MNYLAHLFFAHPSTASMHGNLMGDFAQGLDIRTLPPAVQQGIANHRAIDRFTDQHPQVRQLKQHLSDKRRRYAGIITDIIFDHYLVKHWQRYSGQAFDVFVRTTYSHIEPRQPYVPERMQTMLDRMIRQDWLRGYGEIDNIGRAIDRLSARIRFENHLAGALDEVLAHERHYEQAFLAFFPELQQHVEQQAIEGQHH